MGSSCLILWGSELEMRKVTEITRRLEHRDFLTAAQPLHVLAYEAMLLANRKMDTDSDDAILAELIFVPLLKRECLYDKEEGSSDAEEERACDERLGFCSDEDEGDWEYEHYLCQDLEFSSIPAHPGSGREETEELQARLTEQLLGKEISSRVTTRFGVLSDQAHPDYMGPSKMFLYIASEGCFHHWSADTSEPKFLVQALDPNTSSKSELESWAFYKVSKLLGFEDVQPKLIVAWENSYRSIY